MKQCNSCHSMVNDSCNFCSRCGSNSFTQADQGGNSTITDTGVATGGKSRKGLLGAIVAAAVLLIAGAIAAAILLNPVNRLMNSIEKDSFENARLLYENKITDDFDSYQKAHDQVWALAEQWLEQYCNQEISYDYLIGKLDGLDHVGILGIELQDFYSEADYLRYCRETFAAAEKAFEDGDYQGALGLYCMIAGADFENGEVASDRYDESVTLYRQQVVKEARSYITAGEFIMAYSLLDSALETLPGDMELLAVQQECIQAEYDHDIHMLLEEARLYMTNRDHVGALTFLDAAIQAYPEEMLLQQERSLCLTEFESYVHQESLRLAREGEYHHALSLAESGLSYFSSTDITELAIIYRSYIPVILGEMEMFQNNTKGGSWANKTDETDRYLEDNYGNVYTNSLSVGCGSVTYLVNFKYQIFKGVVGFPKGLESDSYRHSATLQIYGDDEMIAEFADVDGKSKPESFALDISSYEKITLKWTCTGANIWYDWGYFATVFDGFLVPIPLELPE